MNPLHPLTHGNILIVGTKPSNFDDEIKTNPRVIMWDSQQEHWTSKELPHNVRAVFITRFIGHAAFDKILREARKKQITVFNPLGTGIIAKQVKELLALNQPKFNPAEFDALNADYEPIIKEETIVPTNSQDRFKQKLDVLHQYIDWNKTPAENARFMLTKASEHGITTTFGSLAQLIYTLRRRRTKGKVVTPKIKTTDVSVQMLDDLIRGLTDIRDYLVATTEENKTLRARVEKLKSILG